MMKIKILNIQSVKDRTVFNDSKVQKAFTLFELLIVIVIIGIVYSVFVQNIDLLSRKDSVKFEYLKKYLKKYHEKNEVSLICLDECQKCNIYIDDNKTEIEINLFKSEPKTYFLSRDDILDDFQFGRINSDDDFVSKDICFQFDIFENGSSSEYIVEYDKKYYIFFPYFRDVEIMNNIDEAKDFLLDMKLKLKD